MVDLLPVIIAAIPTFDGKSEGEIIRD